MADWTFTLTPNLPAPSWGSLRVGSKGWDISYPKAREVTRVPLSGHGVIDLSTALTDGEPVYESRLVTIPLWVIPSSRRATVDNLHAAHLWLSAVHGITSAEMRVSSLPGYYLRGRLDASDLQVRDLNGVVSGVLQMVASPLWIANTITNRPAVTATAGGVSVSVPSIGRSVPLLVTNTALITINDGVTTFSVRPGTAKSVPGLVLPWNKPAALVVKGTGSVTIGYRGVRL